MIVLSIGARKDFAEIEIRVPKTTAPTKGLWLLEASRLIWEIWPRLGWNTMTERKISPEDWRKPFKGEEKDIIMSMIERLLKVMEISIPEEGRDFEAVMESISKIADELKEGDFELLKCQETEDFRGVVLKVLLIGVLRGLDTDSADEMEFFSDPIYKQFFYDKTYVKTEEEFVFYEAKGSYVSTYTVQTVYNFATHSVHLRE